MTTANLSEPELPSPPVEKELPVPQYHDTDSKPLIILLLIVLLVALLGMVGIFLWAKQASLSNDVKVVKNFTVSTPTPSPTINTEATDSASWKTYKNTDYSIKYPSSLQASTSGSVLNIKDKTGEFKLVINTEPTGLSLSNYVDQKTWCSNITSTMGAVYQLDYEKSLRFEKTPCGLSGSTDIYTVHSGIAYHLSIATQQNYERDLPIFNQILSTFKFTNQ